MRSAVLHVVCICLLSAIPAAAGIAQERGLPDITVPVAPAQPTYSPPAQSRNIPAPPALNPPQRAVPPGAQEF